MFTSLPFPPVKTIEDTRAFVAAIQAQPGFRMPAACGVGIAQLDSHGEPRDTWFPSAVIGAEHPGVASLLVNETGWSGTTGYQFADRPSSNAVGNVRHALLPFRGDGNDHPNLEALDLLLSTLNGTGIGRKLVAVFIDDLSTPPTSVPDAYLRLHLRSFRGGGPKGLNMDGIEEHLPFNVWTNHGPFSQDEFRAQRARCISKGEPLPVIYGQGRYPRLIDYILPPGEILAPETLRLGD